MICRWSFSVRWLFNGPPWPMRLCRCGRSCSNPPPSMRSRSEEHTSELQSRSDLVCRLLLEKKKNKTCALLIDPKSPHLNTTHDQISYDVFALKKTNYDRSVLNSAPCRPTITPTSTVSTCQQ